MELTKKDNKTLEEKEVIIPKVAPLIVKLPQELVAAASAKSDS